VEEKRAASAFENASFLAELTEAMGLRSPNAVFCFSPLRVAIGRDEQSF
jgi:hypothetical protein